MPAPLKAAVWMIGAIVSFTLMAVAGRAASFEFDTFEIMFYRSLIGFAIVISAASAFGTLGQVSRQKAGLHVVRNIAHFTGQNLWFFAITIAPLAQVFALEFTGPVWVVMLAPLMLGEPFRRVGLVAALIGLAGVVIVARPWTDGIGPGILPAGAAALAFAFTALFTRKLTRTDSITSIMVWLTGLQAVFGLICAGVDLDVALPSQQTLPWLLVIGCAGLLAHVCLTMALSLAPASIVMPMDFARLPVIAVVGAQFYDERIEATLVIGGAMILLANWINLRRAR